MWLVAIEISCPNFHFRLFSFFFFSDGRPNQIVDPSRVTHKAIEHQPTKMSISEFRRKKLLYVFNVFFGKYLQHTARATTIQPDQSRGR